MPLQSLLGKKIYRALVAEVGGGKHQRLGGPMRKGIKAKGTPSRGVHPVGERATWAIQVCDSILQNCVSSNIEAPI